MKTHMESARSKYGSLCTKRLKNHEFSRPLHIERLEERCLLSVDLRMLTFETPPGSLDLSVTYRVEGQASPAFDIGIYRSIEGVTRGLLFTTYEVEGTEADVGEHTVLIPANFEDAPLDYYLIAKLDAYEEVAETDETPASNELLFDGGIFLGHKGTTNVVGRSVMEGAAMATDTFALLPGQNALARNYTTYANGISGVLIDIWNVPDPALPGVNPISQDDFPFKIGTDNTPGTWGNAPAPSSMDLATLDDGVGGGDPGRAVQYVPTAGGPELAWRLNVKTLDRAHRFDASVSAVDGQLLHLADWVAGAGSGNPVAELPSGEGDAWDVRGNLAA